MKKRLCKKSQVSIKELNKTEPLLTCRKINTCQNYWLPAADRKTAAEELITGCRAGGIKTAGTLYRLIYGT